MVTIELCDEQSRWDDNVIDGGGHPLQLWGWGEVKSSGSWQVKRVFVYKEGKTIGSAQVLLRRLPWPLKSLAYIPRGPVVAEGNRGVVLKELTKYIKRQYGSVAVSIEPDWELMPEVKGWKKSPNTILLPRTIILDLSKSEDNLLADMAKKTRQYIRKSTKSGLEVRMAKTDQDIADCLKIYKQTAKRADFGLHDDEYYHDIFTKLGDHCQIFMATHEGRVVAFLWLAISEEVAFELYGGMDDQGQRLRANYMLKWEAICRTREWGVRRYDMNGLLNDGVSKFKQSFTSGETELVGTYEKPLSPLYVVWSKGLPVAKRLIRVFKK